MRFLDSLGLGINRVGGTNSRRRFFSSRRFAGLAGVIFSVCACGGAPQRTTVSSARPNQEVEAPPAQDWTQSEDMISRRMQNLARSFGSQISPAPFSMRGFLAGRAHATREIRIPENECLSIVALGSAEIEDLDATLFDSAGNLLAEDVEPDAHPTIQICAAGEDRIVHYVLGAYEGAGAFLVAAFVTPRSAFAAVAEVMGGRPGTEGVVSDVSFADRSDIRDFADGLGRRGFAAQDPVAFSLAAGQELDIPLPIEVGSCYTVAGFGVAGFGLDLVIRQDANAVVEDRAPIDHASAQFCAESSGAWSARVIARYSSGESQVVLLVFSAPSERIGHPDSFWLGEPSGERSARDAVPTSDANDALLFGGTLQVGEVQLRKFRVRQSGCGTMTVRGARSLWSVRFLESNAAEVDALRACVERGAMMELVVAARGGSGEYRVFWTPEAQTGSRR